jgi:hypothetical protein
MEGAGMRKWLVTWLACYVVGGLMMHEMHHSVLLAQWFAEVRHTLTLLNLCLMCIGHTNMSAGKKH